MNAKTFNVYYKSGEEYKPLPSARVSSIELGDFAEPSTASVEFAAARAGEPLDITHGDLIKITCGSDIIFMGIINRISFGASGARGGSGGFERVGFTASDYRYVLSRTNVVLGSYAHGYDDYDFSAFNPADPASVTVATDDYTYLSGVPAIFNPRGRSNCSTAPISGTWIEGGQPLDVHLFVAEGKGSRWTAKQMIIYLLFFGWARFKKYFDVGSPDDFIGLDDEAFGQTPWHIAVDGLPLTEAIFIICQSVNMRFREDYTTGGVRWQFYRPRTIGAGVAAHDLYIPAVGAKVDSSQPKRCYSFDVQTDSSKTINHAVAAGGRHRYEITAELVPSFADSVVSGNPNPAFIDDADLLQNENPNTIEVFAKYDSRGQSFIQEAFRLWTLNELGEYSFNPYNRDIPQDLRELLGEAAAEDAAGKSRLSLLPRVLLPALTELGLTNDSAGIKVEFSFDGGSSWQPVSCSIINITASGGIYIAEPNLHNIKPAGEQIITSGSLIGKPLSLLTSCLNDVLSSRVFRLDDSRLPGGNDNWKTRIRVSAAIEIEQRMRQYSYIDGGDYLEYYDHTDSHRYWQRSSSSILTGAADTHDDSSQLLYQANRTIEQNGFVAAAGTFVLDEISFDFKTGDVINSLTGRLTLGTITGSIATGAEIVKIVHEPMAQTTRLVTADDRFSI